jgi:glycosyltransferase involved in cell wall biosynthesis
MDAIIKPVISVIMPCYNRAHDLHRVLEAYDLQDVAQPFEVLAVDDASIDDTFALLTGYQPIRYHLRVERQSHNQGPAAARNRALQMVAAPLVIIVGDDILPEPDFVRRHLEAHHYFPAKKTAILGRVRWPEDMPCNTLMKHIDGIGAQQFGYHFLRNGREYSSFHFYTANISVKMDLLRGLDHWFDTDFSYAAWEDSELSYRLWRKQGMRIKYISSPIGNHYHYHTIWTFTMRQYHVGKMGYVLVRKHPELELPLRGPIRKVIRYVLMSMVGYGSGHSFTSLENQALQLASDYEWDSHPWLDILYLRVLDYFYLKGWIDALFGEKGHSTAIHNVNARLKLVGALNLFE